MPYGRDAESRTLSLLESALSSEKKSGVTKEIQALLVSSVMQDLEELVPHLEQRGEELKKEIEKALLQRGKVESDSLRTILSEQRGRVLKEAGRTEAFQMELFSDDERRQIDSNRRYWQRWLQNVEGDLVREPVRITEFYQMATYRIETVGLAYLWPVTG
jgi:seryl-tRNA synthetase